MSLHAETTPHPEPLVQRPHRAVVVSVGLLTALGLATAVTLPLLLDDRSSSATTAMQAQLQQVAAAQDSWKAEHGSYTTQLDDLRLTEPDDDVAIVRADDAGFCVGAYDSGTGSAVFYSPADGFTATSCS